MSRWWAGLGLCLGFWLGGCGGLPQIIVLKDPLSGPEWIRLGVGYERQGEWEAALRAYQKALRHIPWKEWPRIYLLMGNVRAQQGDWEAAVGYYRKAVDVDPFYALGYNNLAWAHLQLGQLPEAREMARRALVLEPLNPVFQDTWNRIEEAHP